MKYKNKPTKFYSKEVNEFCEYAIKAGIESNIFVDDINRVRSVIRKRLQSIRDSTPDDDQFCMAATEYIQQLFASAKKYLENDG